MLKRIAGLVSKHRLAVKVLTDPIHCRTLQRRNFILRFRHFDLDRAGRRPF